MYRTVQMLLLKNVVFVLYCCYITEQETGSVLEDMSSLSSKRSYHGYAMCGYLFILRLELLLSDQKMDSGHGYFLKEPDLHLVIYWIMF